MCLSYIYQTVKHFLNKRELKIILKEKVKTRAIEQNSKKFNLHSGKIMRIVPTIGVDITITSCQEIRITVWDMANPHHKLELCHEFFRNMKAVFFMVDTIEAANKLKLKVDKDPLVENVVLVFIDKEDMPNTMVDQHPIDKIRFYEMQNKKWFVLEWECVDE